MNLHTISLSLNGQQHAMLKKHLHPGDGKEAVAFLLCGYRRVEAQLTFCARNIVLLPHALCDVREADQVCWPTDFLSEHLDTCAKQGLCLIKVHSHPGSYERFSDRDDQADRELFPGVYAWCGPLSPAHGSAVMLADGRMFGRLVSEAGEFLPFKVVRMGGTDLQYWFGQDFDLPDSGSCSNEPVPESARRHAQAFGAGTYHALRRLSVAVVGYSGTGSPVVEQLARLGVGRMVLIDPDVVEEKILIAF